MANYKIVHYCCQTTNLLHSNVVSHFALYDMLLVRLLFTTFFLHFWWQMIILLILAIIGIRHAIFDIKSVSRFLEYENATYRYPARGRKNPYFSVAQVKHFKKVCANTLSFTNCYTTVKKSDCQGKPNFKRKADRPAFYISPLRKRFGATCRKISS